MRLRPRKRPPSQHPEQPLRLSHEIRRCGFRRLLRGGSGLLENGGYLVESSAEWGEGLAGGEGGGREHGAERRGYCVEGVEVEAS